MFDPASENFMIEVFLIGLVLQMVASVVTAVVAVQILRKLSK